MIDLPRDKGQPQLPLETPKDGELPRPPIVKKLLDPFVRAIQVSRTDRDLDQVTRASRDFCLSMQL
jgi:hypothetical protein